jgi:lipopolysaccharide biosynthesis regulator YciM
VNERDHALYELGQDFLKAGLLDRAEEAFHRLPTATTRSARSGRC